MWLILPYSHLAARTPDEQAAARNVFVRLKELGHGAPRLKRCLEPHRHHDRDIGCARIQGML